MKSWSSRSMVSCFRFRSGLDSLPVTLRNCFSVGSRRTHLRNIKKRKTSMRQRAWVFSLVHQFHYTCLIVVRPRNPHAFARRLEHRLGHDLGADKRHVLRSLLHFRKVFRRSRKFDFFGLKIARRLRGGNEWCDFLFESFSQAFHRTQSPT